MFCSNSTFAANIFSSLWNLNSDNTIAQVYHAKNKNNVFASVMIQKQRTNISLLKEADFLNKLQSEKKEILTMIGITQWKLTKNQWVQNNLYMEGTYQDKNGTKIFFKEVHIYHSDSFKQLLFTQNASQKYFSKLADSFFNYFQRKRLKK